MANLKQNFLGFQQKQATVREFVVLLTFGLIGYTIAHLVFPPRLNLSAQANTAQILVLEEIKTIRKELKQKLGSTETLPASPSPTQTPPASPSPTQTPPASLSPTETATASPTSESQNLLPAATVDQWMQNLQQNLQVFLRERPNKEGDVNTILKTLNEDFKKLNQSLQQQPTDLENNRKIVTSIDNDLTKLQSYVEEQTLFWTGDLKWVEVIIWSLFGTLVFLIQQTSQYYLREEDANNSEESTTIILTRRKPQYYSLIIQSPFISLVILWVLSLAQLNIAGVSLVFASIPEAVLVSLAFVLGLYNQVATTQLGMIVGAIFKDAWQKTLRKIEISPSNEVVEYGNYKQFSVIPDVKVRWSIWSKPELGVIDAATGMYIAAPYRYFYDSDGKLTQLPDEDIVNIQDKNINFQQVVIRAVREDEESISALAIVILKHPQDPDPSWLRQKKSEENRETGEANPPISSTESISPPLENRENPETSEANSQNPPTESTSLPVENGENPETSKVNPPTPPTEPADDD